MRLVIPHGLSESIMGEGAWRQQEEGYQRLPPLSLWRAFRKILTDTQYRLCTWKSSMK
jgi:hypothetical protein